MELRLYPILVQYNTQRVVAKKGLFCILQGRYQPQSSQNRRISMLVMSCEMTLCGSSCYPLTKPLTIL